jgi:hypothetical protein
VRHQENRDQSEQKEGADAWEFWGAALGWDAAPRSAQVKKKSRGKRRSIAGFVGSRCHQELERMSQYGAGAAKRTMQHSRHLMNDVMAGRTLQQHSDMVMYGMVNSPCTKRRL